MVGAPTPAPAEMWEPGVGVGVAMTTEGRGFGLKAFPSLNTGQMSKYPLPNAPPPDTHIYTCAPPLRLGGWLNGGASWEPCPPPPQSVAWPAFLPDSGAAAAPRSPLRPLSDLCVSVGAALLPPRNFSFGAGICRRAGRLGVSLSPPPPES